MKNFKPNLSHPRPHLEGIISQVLMRNDDHYIPRDLRGKGKGVDKGVLQIYQFRTICNHNTVNVLFFGGEEQSWEGRSKEGKLPQRSLVSKRAQKSEF